MRSLTNHRAYYLGFRLQDLLVQWEHIFHASCRIVFFFSLVCILGTKKCSQENNRNHKSQPSNLRCCLPDRQQVGERREEAQRAPRSCLAQAEPLAAEQRRRAGGGRKRDQVLRADFPTEARGWFVRAAWNTQLKGTDTQLPSPVQQLRKCVVMWFGYHNCIVATAVQQRNAL